MAEYIVGIADDSVQDTYRLYCEYAVNGTIIRCKDCEYYDGTECLIKKGWFPVQPDWFCADGERR